MVHQPVMSNEEIINLKPNVERSISLYTTINLPSFTNHQPLEKDLTEAVWHFYTWVVSVGNRSAVPDQHIVSGITSCILDYYDEIRIVIDPEKVKYFIALIGHIFPRFKVPSLPLISEGWVSCDGPGGSMIEIDIIEVKVISSGLMVIFYGYPDRVPSVDKGENTVWGNWSIKIFNVPDMYPKNLTIANMSVESFKTGRVKKEHSIEDVMKGWTGSSDNGDSTKPVIIKPTRIV